MASKIQPFWLEIVSRFFSAHDLGRSSHMQIPRRLWAMKQARPLMTGPWRSRMSGWLHVSCGIPGQANTPANLPLLMSAFIDVFHDMWPTWIPSSSAQTTRRPPQTMKLLNPSLVHPLNIHLRNNKTFSHSTALVLYPGLEWDVKNLQSCQAPSANHRVGPRSITRVRYKETLKVQSVLLEALSILVLSLKPNIRKSTNLQGVLLKALSITLHSSPKWEIQGHIW